LVEHSIQISKNFRKIQSSNFNVQCSIFDSIVVFSSFILQKIFSSSSSSSKTIFKLLFPETSNQIRKKNVNCYRADLVLKRERSNGNNSTPSSFWIKKLLLQQRLVLIQFGKKKKKNQHQRTRKSSEKNSNKEEKWMGFVS